jgi:DNA-damage-inducible protein J
MEGGIPFSVRQPRFNTETEAAMQEARDIASGKIAAKKYHSAHEMIKDITDEV